MRDCGELERLIRAGYSCISIVTHEETYALETVGVVALNLNCPLWTWSLGTGVRDGLLSNSFPIADTEICAGAWLNGATNSVVPCSRGVHVFIFTPSLPG